jgi:hypothetical protein
VVALLAAFLIPGDPVREVGGQETALPPQLQVDFFTRILSFDLGLEERADAQIVVGVLFQDRYRASFRVKDQLMEAAGEEELTAGGIPIRFIPVELRGSDTFAEDIKDAGVNHVYLTPLRAVDVVGITSSATAEGILTLTAVPEFMDEGVAVGLGTRAGRPEILINRGVAEAVGARFSPELLNLARIVTAGGDG